MKFVIANLEESVTIEDLSELVSDIGDVRKVSMKGKGVAEIIFVKMEAAQKAVEMYDKRLLDGRPMKCTIEGGVQKSVQPELIRLAEKEQRKQK